MGRWEVGCEILTGVMDRLELSVVGCESPTGVMDRLELDVRSLPGLVDRLEAVCGWL